LKFIEIKALSREDKRSNAFIIGFFERASLLFSTWKGRGCDRHHLSTILTWICQLPKHIFAVKFDIHLTQEKWMCKRIFRWNAQIRILFKHPCQQIKGYRVNSTINLFIEIELTLPILSQYLLIPLALKHWASKQKIMEDDSCRKNVTDGIAFGRHIFDIDNLRGHKARRATSYKQILLLFCVSSKTKIAYRQFSRILFFEQNILWLQISMNDLVLR